MLPRLYFYIHQQILWKLRQVTAWEIQNVNSEYQWSCWNYVSMNDSVEFALRIQKRPSISLYVSTVPSGAEYEEPFSSLELCSLFAFKSPHIFQMECTILLYEFSFMHHLIRSMFTGWVFYLEIIKYLMKYASYENMTAIKTFFKFNLKNKMIDSTIDDKSVR